MKDLKFNYFKQKVLKHLNTLIQKEEKDSKKKETKKSFGDYLQDVYKAMGRGHLVPKRVSVTNPKTGKTFQTTVYINPNKKNGKKIYHADSKGARISLGKLKKQCEKCTNSNELMQLILDNRERFSDENGRPLPIAQELSNYVSQLNDKMESAIKPTRIEGHNNRSEAMKENQNAKKDFKDLTSIIKNKASLNLENDIIGEVNLTYDVNKSDLKHIIERRYSELKNKYHVEGENERRKLLTSFVFSLLQTIKHGSATLQKDGRSYILKHNGISAIARQNKAGKVVITGFVDNSNEKEGAETIAAVNADYGYTPEWT